MMKKVVIILACVAVGFLAGVATSTLEHGDWLPVRTADGRCGAYDVVEHVTVGEFDISPDGHCHMSAFLARRVLTLGLK